MAFRPLNGEGHDASTRPIIRDFPSEPSRIRKPFGYSADFRSASYVWASPASGGSTYAIIGVAGTGATAFETLAAVDVVERGMSDQPGGDLIDTKLALTEQRIETRLVGIEAKIDRVLDRVEIAIKASEKAETAADEAKRSSSNIKWNILFTAIGVAAVLVAAFALWAQGVEMMGTLLSTKDQLTGQ